MFIKHVKYIFSQASKGILSSIFYVQNPITCHFFTIFFSINVLEAMDVCLYFYEKIIIANIAPFPQFHVPSLGCKRASSFAVPV